MNKKGISLIILTVTIIVLTILAGAAILSLRKSNQVGKAAEMAFKSDVKELQSALSLYISNETMTNRNFSLDQVSASSAYDIQKMLPNFPDKYDGSFKIEKGSLIYIGGDNSELLWASELHATSDTVIDISTGTTVNPDTLVD